MSIPRQEIKFASEEISQIHLDEILKINNFKELYSPRVIYSTYCDTINDTFLVENIEGHGYRKKIRVRYYQNINKLSHPSVINLEEKRKYISSTTKVRETLTEDKYTITHIYDQEYNDKIPIVLPNDRMYPGLVPKCIVAYNRRYYTDNNIRLTVDNSIRVAEIDSHTHSVSNFYQLKRFIIAELKSGLTTDLREYERMMLNISSVNRTKLSKYVLARSFFNPTIDCYYPEQTRFGSATKKY